MTDSIARQILRAEQSPPGFIASLLAPLAPVAKPLRFCGGVVVDYVLPVYARLLDAALWLYNKLPTDLFAALCGLGLSFGGGAHCASVAAFEAVRISPGWERTQAAATQIGDELRAVYAANASDETRLSGEELWSHKLSVWARAVKDPEKLADAFGGLCSAWLAVQSVLRLEFARTVTLGVSIAEMATPALARLLVPVAVHVLPAPYHHWVPLGVKSSARMIGVAVAWRLQVVVSAAHLALRGGLLFSRSLLRYARRRGVITWSEDETHIDEVVGYAVAAAGLGCQLSYGFALAFPLNVVLAPLTAVEWYIRWSITASPAIA